MDEGDSAEGDARLERQDSGFESDAPQPDEIDSDGAVKNATDDSHIEEENMEMLMSLDNSHNEMKPLFSENVWCNRVRQESGLVILDALTPFLHREGVEEAVKSLAMLLHFNSLDMPFLTSVIHAEVLATRESFALFRETTARSLLLSTYMHIIGARFLSDVLQPIIFEVLEPHSTLSPDSHADIIYICDNVLRTLIHSVEKLPTTIRSVFSALLRVTMVKFPTDKYTALGGLFLLRLVCPALASPIRYRMIDSETSLGIRELKIFALSSKVLLMAGVGSRFNEPDKADLNKFLSRASPTVLRLLDSITSTFSVSRKIPLMRSRARTVSSSLQKIPMDLMIDNTKYTLLVDKSMTTEVVREIACRMKCPPPLPPNIAATRKALKNRQILIGPRGGCQLDTAPEKYLLLGNSDLVWQGSSLPEYALWFVAITDDKEEGLKKSQKAREKQVSTIVVVHNGVEMTFPITMETTVDELRERIVNILAEKVSGEESVALKHSLRDHWLFVEGYDDRPMIPSGSVIFLEEYNSLPSRLMFQAMDEEHRRKFAKLRLQQRMTRDNSGLVSQEKGIVRIYRDDEVGFRTVPVNRSSRALDVFRLLMNKLVKEYANHCTPEEVLMRFSNYWLFEVVPQPGFNVRSHRRDRSTSEKLSDLLFSIRRRGSSGSIDEDIGGKLEEHRKRLVCKRMLPTGDIVWMHEIEPDLYFKEATPSELRQLRLNIRHYLIETVCPDLTLPAVASVQEEMEDERRANVLSIMTCLKLHAEDIISSVCERVGVSREELSKTEAPFDSLSFDQPFREGNDDGYGGDVDRHETDELKATVVTKEHAMSVLQGFVNLLDDFEADQALFTPRPACTTTSQ